jgi:hypothetical protein
MFIKLAADIYIAVKLKIMTHTAKLEVITAVAARLFSGIWHQHFG